MALGLVAKGAVLAARHLKGDWCIARDFSPDGIGRSGKGSRKLCQVEGIGLY
jgi:hypothetical protein